MNHPNLLQTRASMKRLPPKTTKITQYPYNKEGVSTSHDSQKQ